MGEQKTLKIDFAELCSALEDSSYEHNYYLNLKTGEILFISAYMDAEKIRGKIDQNPDRYEPMPRAEPYEG